MRCPKCGGSKSSVIDSRQAEDGNTIRHFVFARFAQFGDDDFDAFGFQHGGKQQTDRTCATDQCDVACFRAAADISVMTDGQRLNQSGLV